jgi:DNA-binding FadR family transcriptional regulator
MTPRLERDTDKLPPIRAVPTPVARTASEAVAELLRGSIAGGRLKPGDMLPPESTLLEQFGVARSTMREALRILESDGLVVILRGTKGGARVQEPDVRPLARRVGLHLQLKGTDLRELVEAQAIVQPGVVALAARARTADDIVRLRATVEACARPETVDEYLDAVVAFTDALLAAAHNTALALYEQLTAALLRDGLAAYVLRYNITLADVDHRIAWSAIQFATLVDLIEAGDADAGEAFWGECLREPDPLAPHPAPLEVYSPGPKRRRKRPTTGKK